jgi:hypothetical protein
MGENETFIKLVSDPEHPLGREHWAINSTAKIAPNGKLTSSGFLAQLRHAWGHLRFHYPSLAAHIAEDNEKVLYKVPKSEEVAQWVKETFTVVEQALSSAEVIPKLKPSQDAILIYIPRSNKILYHTAHWRTDGIGVILLLDRFLQLAVEANLTDPASLPWGEEPKRLAPAVEDAEDVSLAPNDQQSALSDHYVSTFGLDGGAVGIPYVGEVSSLPQGTYAATQILDAATTNAIVEKGKVQSSRIKRHFRSSC